MPDFYQFCIFDGDPPPRYKTWKDYMDCPIKEGVFIRAARQDDLPSWWTGEEEAWKDLEPEPEWPCSQGSDFKVGDIVHYHPEGTLRPHDGSLWEIEGILDLVWPAANIREYQSGRSKCVMVSNLSRIENRTPAGKPPWILQALDTSTGKVLPLDQVRIKLEGRSLSQEIIEERGVDLEPIKKVWDQFKHLDRNILEIEPGSRGHFKSLVIKELWQAIKQVLGEK